MATNGLTTKEEKILRDHLRKAAALERGVAYLGGGQRREFEQLVTDINARLEPATVESLTERAETAFTWFRQIENNVPWLRGALEGADAA